MATAKTLGVGLLVLCLGLAGCADPASRKSKGKPTNATTSAEEKKGHEHGAGPNGGVVFDLGKYHAEFTVNHDKKECTVLILGNDEKTPKAVSASELTLTTKESKTKEGKAVAPMTIKLLPHDGKDGKATRFVGTDPGLGSVADFEGTVIGEIEGRPVEGEFKE